MKLTLREALKLAEPLRGARVLGGADALDNVVSSVNVMEVPDILDWVHPGELLVTTMYPLRDDPAAIAKLVPGLSKKGLAGLAVTVEPYLEAHLPQMIAAAERLAFPLIQLPPRVSFIDIIQPLTSRILDLQAEELRQSDHILRRLLDLVLIGGDYAAIAQVVAEVAGHAVSIVDRFRRVLGRGGEMAARWRDLLLERDSAGDEYLAAAYTPTFVASDSERTVRRARVLVGKTALDHVVCAIEVSGAELGSIIVWGPLAEDIEARAVMALEHAATVAALKMMERQSISQVEQQFRNEILEGLLSDQPAARRNAAQASERLGSRLATPFVVVVVGPDVAPDTFLAQKGRDEQNSVESSLHLARRYLRVLHDGATFWRRGPHLVAFVPLGKKGGVERSGLVEPLRRLCARIASENKPYSVSIGVSRVAETLDGFRQAYGDARHSLEVGRALSGGEGCHVQHFEDLGLYRFVPAVESAGTLRAFCEDALRPLLERDRRGSASLVETLRVFLAKNQNHAETARALGVHYNTLRYRLARIRDIVGDALSDPQRRLTLEVALQLYPLVASAEERREGAASL